jgi:hypothetical protein
MKYGTTNIGGFFIIELASDRIIKEHKHLKTAENHWRKLGKTGYIIKPVADREAYYAHRKVVGNFPTMSVS